MNKLVLISLCLFAAPSYGEQWLCITEHSAGFKYDENQKKWRSTRFTVNDDKFVIEKSDLEGFELEVKYQESAVVVAGCKEGFSLIGNLICGGFTTFKFNKNNGRFIMTFDTGYWAVNTENEFMPSDEESESPYMNIGNCLLVKDSEKNN